MYHRSQIIWNQKSFANLHSKFEQETKNRDLKKKIGNSESKKGQKVTKNGSERVSEEKVPIPIPEWSDWLGIRNTSNPHLRGTDTHPWTDGPQRRLRHHDRHPLQGCHPSRQGIFNKTHLKHFLLLPTFQKSHSALSPAYRL